MSISDHVSTTVRYVDNHSAAVNASADDDRNLSLAVVEVAVMATVLTLAVFGNLMVVLSLTMKTRKMSRMHLMLMHLSLADLFVAFFNVLPQMMWDITFRFQGGPFLCGAVKYFQLVAMYASSYVLLSTAIDRYVAICHPFVSQKWTSLQAHLLVLAAWLASLVFSIPQVFIFSLTEVSEGLGVYDCWEKFDPPWTLKLYVTWNTVSVFIVPTLILAVLYGQISFAVWRSSKMVEKLVPYSSKQSVTSSPCSCHHGTLRPQGPRESCQQDLQRHCTAKTTEVTSEPVHSTAGHPDCTRRFRSPNGLVHAPTLGGFARSGKEEDVKRSGESGGAFAKSSARRVALLNWRLRREGPPRQQSPGNASARHRGDVGISRAKIKTIKLTLTVIICYLLCWAPFYIAQVWAAYDDSAPFEGNVFVIVLLLANLNSCTNPWIYMVFSDTVCKGFKDLFNSLLDHVTTACCCCRGEGVTSGGQRHQYNMHVRAGVSQWETECTCSVTEA